jgi:multicomponent Na+:H+ antiporter subunit C
MTVITLYALAGVALFTFGLFALVTRRHLLLKILAGNVAGSGAFLVFMAIANRGTDGPPDPIPQAMVLTGIVVAVSTTALALNLAVRIKTATGQAFFGGPDDGEERER